MSDSTRRTHGLIYGLAAYGLWGMMPLYFRVVKSVAPLELLAHRVVWSVLLLAVLITALGRWSELRDCLGHARTRWMLLASTLLIAVNWYVFIYGVAIGRVVQNSLGYFINPLLNIVLGVCLFRECLRPAQWLALGLAAAGLAYLICALGELPWIALSLAFSFAGYGVIRKVAPVESLVGLAVETLFLAPVALVGLAVGAAQGRLALGSLGPALDAAVVASGVVTAVPLLCFGAAARRLPLSVLGFLQYLAPTLQFLLAVFAFGEPFRPEQRIAFPLIWSALLVVTVDGLLARRGLRGGRKEADAVAELT